MKPKTARFAAVILFTAMMLDGCAKQPPALSILADITDYSIGMSSTPGIPLTAVLSRNLENSKNYKYHWLTQKGTFLNWNDGAGFGRIDVMGPDVLTNLHRVYWTMDSGRPIQESFQVCLTIEDAGTGTIVEEASLEIHPNEPGHFTITD